MDWDWNALIAQASEEKIEVEKLGDRNDFRLVEWVMLDGLECQVLIQRRPYY